jgi:adenylate cyclase
MNNRWFNIPFSFRTKVFIVLAGVVCLAIFSILFILQETTRNRVQENIKERFQNSRVALEHLQELRKQYAIDAIKTLSNSNAQFRSILSTASVSINNLGFGNPGNEKELQKDANLRLNSLLPFISMYHEFDLFIVVDAEGTLLFSKTAPENFGEDLTSLSLFEQLEHQGDAVDIWFAGTQTENNLLISPEQRDAAYYVIATPVEFREEIHGAVICAKRIDNSTLSRLKSISGTDLTLYSVEGVLASTLSSAKIQFLSLYLKTATHKNNTAIYEVDLDKEVFLSMHFPILPNVRLEKGGFIVLKSYTQEIKFLSRLRLTFLLVGGIILIIAIGFSFILARGITKPLKQLSLAAKDIGAGQLDIKVDIRTGDEIENLGSAFNDMVKGLKEREFIKRTFERYVSPTVAAEIMKNPDMLRLGGQKKKITVFFTDIGDYTNLSETLSPEEVVRHINEYFQGMCNAILDYDGTINEFQGDAILAFWGAPIDQEKHALLACRAALSCQEFLRHLEAKWIAEGLPPRTYRFGLNTGDVVVGNIGSASRFKYGVIGDNVNLASRLETANKYYGTQIFISEQTYSLINDRLIAREIDIIQVVGKSKPVKVYELVAEKEKIDEKKAESLEHFGAGLYAYRRREWEDAVLCFEKVLCQTPEDSPSKVYIQRCKAYQKTAPSSDWNGVHELQAK